MKISQIKRDMRINLMEEVAQFLKEKYGVKNCRQVSANELGVIVGSYNDNGFINDTTCVVKISAKPFYFKEATAESKEIEAYDLQAEAENYIKGIEP